MAPALRPTRKRVLVLGAVVVVAIVVVVLLIAGGSETRTRYGDVWPAPAGGERPAVPFGQAVRLKTSRTTIEVRPFGFSRQPASAAAGPSITIDLSVRNVGREPYLDQPTQAAAVVLGAGDELDRIYEPVGRCRGVSPDTVRLSPGESRRWCVAFENRGRPELFVYAPEAGLPRDRGAPESAAWRLDRRARAGG
ncbi:MAG TPA: hypothetical protein VE528_06375 [Thermoleophilaceae bacterium]|jgi:hypothetical protein|nr:hypothetical protein [Thermoleophilaceae bacterium]